MLRYWAKGVAAVMLLGVIGSTALADTVRELEPSTEPIHIRVLFYTQPAHEAVVSWTTTAEGEDHRLYVDTQPREGDLEAYQWSFEPDRSVPYSLRDNEAAAGMDSWGHSVHLSDLEPATRYYLTVVSDGDQSDEYYFKTAPNDGRPVELLLVGDSRVGGARTHENNNRRRVNALMRDLLEERPEIVAMAHGADYTNRAFWSQLYFWLNDHHEKTTTRDGRLLPIIPSRGNHDMDVGFEEMFWWPDRENDYYYTTQLSGDVAFITLNSEISIGGDQGAWLEEELPKLRPHNRWIAGQWHRPAYPSVRDFDHGRTRAIRETWVSLFERYGLDLGYEAHDHALKRTHPIYGGEIDVERGIVYIGDGGGGVAQRQPQSDRWYLKVTGRHHHAHLLRFTDEKLEGVALDFDHETVDQFTLIQDRRDWADE